MTAMHYNFCTLFDRHYATRGLALYLSLEQHCKVDFTFTVLCIDTQTRDFMAKLALPRAKLVLPDELGDPELLALRDVRDRREFCWSCTAPLLRYMLKQAAPGNIVTYVDSDLAFFSDPQPVFDEMGDQDIAIHGHRFSPAYEKSAATSGIFNVGLIAVRNSPEGRACVERWRGQCLEKCELDPDKGYCGDQKYLDEWPSLYKNLVVLQHPGVCVAPWNIHSHVIDERNGWVTVDGKPLIFYHFHGLVPLTMNFLGKCAVVPARGYDVNDLQCRLIYKPYTRLLRTAQATADHGAPGAIGRPRIRFVNLWATLRSKQLVWG